MTATSRFRLVGSLPAVLLLVAACTGGPASPAAPSPAGQGSPGPGGPRIIEVKATDALRFEPAAITVRVGGTVRFVVSNTGSLDHEFYVGDAAAQAAHEQDMAHGGMMHGDPNGIEVTAGKTGELEMRFDKPGELLIGCHVLGHYAAGMKATLTVEG